MRKILTVAGVIVAVALVALAIYRYIPKQNDSNGAEHVTIDEASRTLLNLPLYVAFDQGFLEDQGVQAQIVTAGGDSSAFAALASGQAQFAQGDPTFAAVSHEKRGPGIVVASALDRIAIWGVSFRPEIKPMATGAGFRGLTVVTYADPNTAYALQKDLVANAGLRLGSNTFILPSAPGAELEPLREGKAQVAMSAEPTVSQAVAEGARVVFSFPEARGPFLQRGLMTTEDFAAKNAGTVRDVVNSYELSLRFIRLNPDGAVAIAQKYFPEVNSSVIRAAINRMTSENAFPEHAQVSLDSWRAALKVRVEAGDLKSENHDDLVQNGFGTQPPGH